MRNILFIIFCISIVSCSSPERKAASLVENYLKEQDHKWLDTDSLWISKLDTVFSVVEDNPEYINLRIKADSLYRKSLDNLEEAREYIGSNADFYVNSLRSKSKELSEEAFSIYEESDKLKENYIPKLAGWKVGTSFISIYKDGQREVQLYGFYFDEGITKILNVENFQEENSAREKRLNEIMTELDTE